MGIKIAKIIQEKLFKTRELKLIPQIEDKEQIIFDYIFLEKNQNYLGFKEFPIRSENLDNLLNEIELFIEENKGYMSYFHQIYFILSSYNSCKNELKKITTLLKSDNQTIIELIKKNEAGIITNFGRKKRIIIEASIKETKSYNKEVMHLLHINNNERYRSTTALISRPDKSLMQIILKRIRYETDITFLFHLFQYLGNLGKEAQKIENEILELAYQKKVEKTRLNIIRGVFPKIGGNVIHKKMFEILDNSSSDDEWHAVISAFDNYPNEKTDLEILKRLQREVIKKKPDDEVISSLLHVFRSDHNWDKFYIRKKYIKSKDMIKPIAKIIESNYEKYITIRVMEIIGDFELEEVIPKLIIKNPRYTSSRFINLGSSETLEYYVIHAVLEQIGFEVIINLSSFDDIKFKENLAKLFGELKDIGMLSEIIENKVIKILIEYLNIEEGEIMANAANALGSFGENAIKAVRKLAEINYQRKNSLAGINAGGSIGKIAKAKGYLDQEKFLEDNCSDIVKLYKKSNLFIEDIILVDPNTKHLAKEINEAYQAGLFTLVIQSTRTLIELNIHTFLRKEFRNENHLWEKELKKGEIEPLMLSKLIANLFNKRELFTKLKMRTDSIEIDELKLKFEKFKNKTNTRIHSNVPKPTSTDIIEIKELVEVILQTLIGLSK